MSNATASAPQRQQFTADNHPGQPAKMVVAGPAIPLDAYMNAAQLARYIAVMLDEGMVAGLYPASAGQPARPDGIRQERPLLLSNALEALSVN